MYNIFETYFFLEKFVQKKAGKCQVHFIEHVGEIELDLFQYQMRVPIAVSNLSAPFGHTNTSTTN